MRILIIILITFTSFVSYSYPIPSDKKVLFDVIRKNKVIGSIETFFENNNDNLIVTTKIDIQVKLLFVTAYKFSQFTKETWLNDNFVSIDGHTDFEDEREYFISGLEINDNFVASGMDGELILDKNILPLNYLNKNILNEKKVFDTQKGIIREIQVKKLENETIKINNKNIEAEKYLLNASTHPKDKGPFPEYTLWYDKNSELLKFSFINWKDKKKITNLRVNWE